VNRIECIQAFIDKRGYRSYLELGVKWGTVLKQIDCAVKDGVDVNPSAPCSFAGMTTAEFFRTHSGLRYDIIFIDADHREPAVLLDLLGSLRILNEDGVVVLHDCRPMTEAEQIDANNECQTAWRAFAAYRLISPYLCYCLDDDYGVGIIDTAQFSCVLEPAPAWPVEYSVFAADRNKYLDLRDRIVE
jgi:hypothetical protein